MKRTLIIVLCIISSQLITAESSIVGVYEHHPDEQALRFIMADPDIVWDSLWIYPDGHYLRKKSMYYDVGGKIVKDTFYGKWSLNGEYISLVPDNVNYRCIPNVAADSIVSLQIFDIDYETKDTISAKKCTIYVDAEDGETIYYTNNKGRVDIICTSPIRAIYINGRYSAEIPFPIAGNLYQVIFPCYGIPYIWASLFKVYNDELWLGWIYKEKVEYSDFYKKIQ